MSTIFNKLSTETSSFLIKKKVDETIISKSKNIVSNIIEKNSNVIIKDREELAIQVLTLIDTLIEKRSITKKELEKKAKESALISEDGKDNPIMYKTIEVTALNKLTDNINKLDQKLQVVLFPEDKHLDNLTNHWNDLKALYNNFKLKT